MRCPTLTELPPPPPGKTGWPWTEESEQLPDTMPDPSTGSGQVAPWPRVSIVTPSYNQAQFIEETIRSVLLQGYPNLEYIIIDGGSTDGSVDIIRKYEKWLAYWVSEPDRGQSNAINKGFAQASGDILAWLNSDDTYEPGAVRVAVEYLQMHPNVGLVYGDYNLVNRIDGIRQKRRAPEFDLGDLICQQLITQPTAFWRREVADAVGQLDEDLHYVMDREYWIRIGRRYQIARNPVVVANVHWHGNSKSIAQTLNFEPEAIMMLDKLFADDSLPEKMRALGGRAYSNAYYELGKKYLVRRDRANARRYLWKAITTWPFRFSIGLWLIYLVDTVWGTGFGNWLATRWRQLRA